MKNDHVNGSMSGFQWHLNFQKYRKKKSPIYPDSRGMVRIFFDLIWTHFDLNTSIYPHPATPDPPIGTSDEKHRTFFWTSYLIIWIYPHPKIGTSEGELRKVVTSDLIMLRYCVVLIYERFFVIRDWQPVEMLLETTHFSRALWYGVMHPLPSGVFSVIGRC